MAENILHTKLEELKQELKNQGLWQTGTPLWVKEFKTGPGMQEVDFNQWLQFVYLPNRLMNPTAFRFEGREDFIALQAKKFAGETLMSKKIVSLLVELDAL